VNLHIRRAFVVAGVAVSLIVGVVSIEVASSLAAAAAPPPAPPVSITTLKSELAAEQGRSASLQQQLDELKGVADSLSEALSSTSDQVSTDGLSADQLRARLIKAQQKLATVTALLATAQARLAAMQGSTSSGSGGSGSGTTSGAGATAAPAATPVASSAPAPTSGGFSLGLVSGGVRVTWPVCTASGFSAYAIVRSLDSEIHYPPEDLDTVAATITTAATTSMVEPVGAGTYWYRVYCLTGTGGQTHTASQTTTLRIVVP
jgi:hypothetical protein